MRIIVNGSARDVERAANLAELVIELGHPDRGIAVAVDEVVVPKGRWAERALEEGQRIEILTAVQGG